MKKMTRGQFAHAAGVNIETIRYYEKIGLLPAPARAENGYRLYSQKHLEQLMFIKTAKQYGFTLREIAAFFAEIQKKKTVKPDLSILVKRKIAEIDKRIDSLDQQKESLSFLLENLAKNECSTAFPFSEIDQ